MSAENWHIRIEDSEITFIDNLLPGPDVEAKVESDVKSFLLSLGIEAKKIPEEAVRTPDYENMEIVFEVTTIHPYFPQLDEIDKIIVDLQNNLENGTMRIFILTQTTNLSSKLYLKKNAMLVARYYV
jgi:hypothetical protein